MKLVLSPILLASAVCATGCAEPESAEPGLRKVPDKKYRLQAAEIRPLAEGHGACFATDMITVDGKPVAYMYREAPDNDIDSGWRFMSGFETDEYMDDPSNLGVYDVNTIANYDPDIIPHLHSPEGAAFEREDGSGPFKPVAFEPPE